MKGWLIIGKIGNDEECLIDETFRTKKHAVEIANELNSKEYNVLKFSVIKISDYALGQFYKRCN